MAYTIDRKCDFDQVTRLLESNPCTPKIKGYDFEGIVINLPEEVGLDAVRPGGRVMLCGRARLKFDLLGLRGDFVDSILFVATNSRTHQTYAGKLESVPNPIRAPVPPVKNDDPELIVGVYFNPNLTKVLRLPPETAEYIVYATLGPHKSNVLRLRVGGGRTQ